MKIVEQFHKKCKYTFFIGVAHADESLLIYYVSLYGITFVKNPLNENDEKVKDILIDYITTFAANGFVFHISYFMYNFDLNLNIAGLHKLKLLIGNL